MRKAQGEQLGLVEVLPEEAPLPSEVALDGGILARRHREALAALRATLSARPEHVDPDDWRVFVATVAPPWGHLQRSTGTAAHAHGYMQMVQECFPQLAPAHALRRFLEVQRRPQVRALIDEFRSLELIDLHAMRAKFREALDFTISRGTDAIMRIDPEVDPSGWSRVAATVTVAIKTAADLDGLNRPQDGDAKAIGDGSSSSTDLLQRVHDVADDMRRRRSLAAHEPV